MGRRRQAEGKHIVLGFVLFVGRYHICERTGPGIYAMTNGRIDTHRQLLCGVVGMLAGMNGPSCSKLASLSTRMPAGLLQYGSEDFLVDSVKLKSEQGSKGGAYKRDCEKTLQISFALHAVPSLSRSLAIIWFSTRDTHSLYAFSAVTSRCPLRMIPTSAFTQRHSERNGGKGPTNTNIQNINFPLDDLLNLLHIHPPFYPSFSHKANRHLCEGRFKGGVG